VVTKPPWADESNPGARYWNFANGEILGQRLRLIACTVGSGVGFLLLPAGSPGSVAQPALRLKSPTDNCAFLLLAAAISRSPEPNLETISRKGF
jgi:hypothetical protein